MLGTIIQSIFCAHPGVGIRLNLWKLLGESRYPGALLLACENIRFSSLFVAGDVYVPSDEERGETDVFAGYSFART